MKLREIYIRCKKCYDVVQEMDAHKISYSDSKFVNDQLKDVEFLSGSFGSLKKYLKNDEDRSQMLLGKRPIGRYIDKDGFEKSKKCLLHKMSAIIDLCESMGMNAEEKKGIDIKIPPNCDFTDYRKIMDDLEFIFLKCPLFKSDTEELKFESVDVGSMWISFIVLSAGTSIILNNIVEFIDKVIILRSHWMTLKMQEAELNKSKMDEKEKLELLKSINKLYKAHIDNAVSDLEEITKCKLKDGDERGRVEQSIEKAEKLINKGLQIYPMIDSPKETKVLFEPLKTKYISIADELKRLTDKKADDNE